MKKTGEEGRFGGPKAFNLVFLALVGCALATAAGAMAGLRQFHMLPAPPLTATYCMDEKFAWLEQAELKRADMIAIGSSATWRNLDMDSFVESGAASRPVNAAMCYLRMNQTAFYGEYLLDRLPEVETVVTVVSPRDFEGCDSDRSDFFDARTGDWYMFDGIYPWWLYASNMKPRVFASDVIRLARMRHLQSEEDLLDNDRYGSSFQHKTLPWSEDVTFADSCFSALTRLEAVVADRGGRLIVATIPIQPEWHRNFDADGAKVQHWIAGIEDAVRLPETVVVRGDLLPFTDAQFGDHIHILAGSVRAFSDTIASGSTPQLAKAGD